MHEYGADRKPICMEVVSMFSPGQHVQVDYQGAGDWVAAIVLSVRDNEAQVQEIGTERAEWVPVTRVRG